MIAVARAHHRWRRWTLILTIGAVLAAAMLGWIAASRWRPAVERFPVQGVAVDATNGPIDWFAARGDSVAFAYVLATSGAGERDAMFDRNWQGLFKAGIPRGAIHSFSLCQPAEGQARLFISTVPRTADMLPGIVQIDRDPGCAAPISRPDAVAAIRAFLTLAEAHQGQPMLLAVSKAAETELAITMAIDRPLVATGRLFEPDYLARPWRLWQASDMRRIAGANGTVRWLVVAP